MLDPIASIRHAIERGALDEVVFLVGGEVDVLDGGCLARLAVCDTDGFEEGGDDQVHVLSGVGEYAHHHERDEGAHGAAIVIAWYPGYGVVEEAWDVLVRALRGERGAPGVVVQEEREEGLLVADV